VHIEFTGAIMADYPEVVYWLAVINESRLRLNVIKPILLRWCVADGRPAADLLGLSALELASTFGISSSDAEQLLAVKSHLPQIATMLSQWRQADLQPIIRADRLYPRRLTYTLPPARQPLVLWARGNVALLNQPGVTILGQMGTEKITIAFIHSLLQVLQEESIALVSGYSRGLDRDTFELLVEGGQGTGVVIIPMGLNAFAKTTSKLNQAVADDRAVLVSPFAPDTAYQEKLADARNILIDHLTTALLVPNSDEDALARGKAALLRGLPVFVKENTEGNRELLNEGALLLTDTGEVVEWVQQAIVDDAMQDSPAEPEPPPEIPAAAPLAETAPSIPSYSDEDFNLRVEDVPPLDSDEALDVLSLGGDIPDILRQRLEKRKSSSSEE
jgi:DNA processing protein